MESLSGLVEGFGHLVQLTIAMLLGQVVHIATLTSSLNYTIVWLD